MGRCRSAAIVAHRAAHGSFSSVDDLWRVRGIGRVTVARLNGLVYCEAEAQAAQKGRRV